MWYEVFTPAGVILVMTSMPALLCPLWNKFWIGNAFNRYTDDQWIEAFWFRDHHLTGNPFKPDGIDNLPDEPPKEFSKKN